MHFLSDSMLSVWLVFLVFFYKERIFGLHNTLVFPKINL